MGTFNRVVLAGVVACRPVQKPVRGGGRSACFCLAVPNDGRSDLRPRDDDRSDAARFECRCYETPNASRRLATVALERLGGPETVLIEGHLAAERWAEKPGGKVYSRTVVVVESFTFLTAPPEPAASEPVVVTAAPSAETDDF